MYVQLSCAVDIDHRPLLRRAMPPMTSVIVVVLGIGVGLALGALGGGGSTLAVPILVFVAGLTPQEATTASLLVVGVAAAVGAVEHVRRGNVRLGVGLLFGLSGIVGSRIGTTINRGIDGDVLLAGFAVLIVFVAVRMYRSVPSRSAGAKRSCDSPERSGPSGASPIRLTDGRTLVRLLLAATAVGLLTGLFGVGGGFAIVPALVLVLGFDTREAIGTSLVVIAVNATVALGLRAGSIDIDWVIVGPFLATVTVGVLAGTWIAARVDAARLTRAFAVMLAVVGAYTLVGALV